MVKNEDTVVFYSSQQLAELLDVPKSTVEYWRAHGGGPPFTRFGKHVRYRKIDIDSWVEAHSREQT